MSKTIFVLLDACGYEAATNNMSYFEQLTEEGGCAKYRVTGQLPSTSRPMYETLMTGLPSTSHGIVSNRYTGPGSSENLFSLCQEHGRTTAAAAYNWFSELYNGTGPFRIGTQRYQLEGNRPIEYGIFYSADQYPDSHLYADAEFLRKQYHPDFLLIHPMGIDDSGHSQGSDSDLYQYRIMQNSEFLSELLPAWRADQYDVVITADHGMNPKGMHGGTEAIQREVPLYLVSDRVLNGDFTSQAVSQLSVAPLVCDLLGIPRGKRMREPEIRLID